MGIFGKLFQSGKGNQDNLHCDELIRFIRFTQKIKPLVQGNHTIWVTYNAPDHNKSEFSADIWAEFKFYDFWDLQFAKQMVPKSKTDPRLKDIAKYQYEAISQKAHLEQQDWPYGMDGYDFGRWITNTDTMGFYFLIQDENFDDMFTMKVKVGFGSYNARAYCDSVVKECKRIYPELVIEKKFANNYRFSFCISI